MYEWMYESGAHRCMYMYVWMNEWTNERTNECTLNDYLSVWWDFTVCHSSSKCYKYIKACQYHTKLSCNNTESLE